MVWFGILPLLRHGARNKAVFDGFAKTFLVERCLIRWDSPLLRHGADMQLRSMVFRFFPTWDDFPRCGNEVLGGIPDTRVMGLMGEGKG